LFLWAGVVFGQSSDKVRLTETERSQLDSLRREGYEALYNLDYEGARRRFQEMTQLFPEHPAGPQCMAASIWLEQLNESWQLKATLYSTESYSENDNQIDKRKIEEFRRWTRQATKLAEARLRHDPHDTEALYFLGTTEGLKAAFAAAVERRFMTALTEGSRSVERHQEVLKLAPDFHDAELTIGLYEYIVGSLPLPVKVLAGTMGVRGSKKRGLQTLERVSKEGDWARDVARVLLIDLYKREKRWVAAVEVSRELANRYPRNYLFKLQMADALVSQVVSLRKMKGASASTGTAEQNEAFRIFESLLNDRATSNDAQARAPFALIHFRYGEALLACGLPESAVKEFLAVHAQVGAEPVLKTMGRLRAAQSMDLAGRRRDALAEYRAVLESPNNDHMHDEARRGLREPYRKRSL
jgi:tetratricopeptide (TPR) repeat protein